ncbi:hypothetical protein GQ42DRAFT_178151 [Ramicandelaber brevisporus]|nr:hypothetical protein GQ42DRAFT_178151 [Ramicandelaber brevisporus]
MSNTGATTAAVAALAAISAVTTLGALAAGYLRTDHQRVQRRKEVRAKLRALITALSNIDKRRGKLERKHVEPILALVDDIRRCNQTPEEFATGAAADTQAGSKLLAVNVAEEDDDGAGSSVTLVAGVSHANKDTGLPVSPSSPKNHHHHHHHNRRHAHHKHISFSDSDDEDLSTGEMQMMMSSSKDTLVGVSSVINGWKTVDRQLAEASEVLLRLLEDVDSVQLTTVLTSHGFQPYVDQSKLGPVSKDKSVTKSAAVSNAGSNDSDALEPLDETMQAMAQKVTAKRKKLVNAIQLHLTSVDAARAELEDFRAAMIDQINPVSSVEI